MQSYSLFPLNLDTEKKKFFFDPLYNPQFIFENPAPEEFLYNKYGEFKGELADRAKKIIDNVIEKWGTESAYLDEVEGKVLDKESATKTIQSYLLECGLEKKVSVKFSPNFIPRTHIEGFIMYVRLPIDYREKSIVGMLDHEIGTHVYRRLNDVNQLWHLKREKYHLSDYLESEEGLAALHYYLNLSQPYLWIYALQYYACYLATTMSFSQVNDAIKKYVSDRERRFKIVLRAKRGLMDTSLKGGYTKDQVYLRGVVKMTRWLEKNDYKIDKFYVGKVSVEDLDRIWGIDPSYQPILPPFYVKSPSEYKKKIKHILETNSFL